jgi:stearoyl-CoA desaturase (Delta-9 desaturase)
VSKEMIDKRAIRTGDGTRTNNQLYREEKDEKKISNDIWGWDDNEMSEDQKQSAKILYKCYD